MVKRVVLRLFLALALALNALVALRLLAPSARAELTAERASEVVDQLEQTAGANPSLTELDGNWTLRTDAPSTVGYRIDEQAAGRDFSTAVGRTSSVTARLVVNDDTLVSVRVVADLRALASDQILRDRVLRDQGLEIDTYPEATFSSTTAINLGGLAAASGILHLSVPGEIALHGVTRPVVAEVNVELRRATVLVTGSLEISLGDFGIDKPSVANILSIADTGVIEWQLFLVREDGEDAGSDGATTSTGDPSVSEPGIQIGITESRLGPILVDGEGSTLYLFGTDQAGQSTCTDACATAWPPAMTVGPPVAGSGVDGDALGTVERADGNLQVTYHGLPLYRCAGDTFPGQVNCQGAGDVWYVLSASGEPVLD